MDHNTDLSVLSPTIGGCHQLAIRPAPTVAAYMVTLNNLRLGEVGIGGRRRLPTGPTLIIAAYMPARTDMHVFQVGRVVRHG